MFSAKNLALPLLASLLSGVLTLPIKREVPQEHSHQQFIDTVSTSLNLNNPDQIQDPVFGLLGDAAAAAGQGKITDTDCLQQATADQAFTNAKAAGDVTGMIAALIYRALERNTGSVGLASVACTSITAVNPEIAAIQQHQDPASAGAAAGNKAVTLALAQQIASVGGDPQDALKAGTFAPGDVTDNTGKGNTCDVADDPVGCIFTQNLLQPDATADEITAAVAGGATGAAGAANSTAAAAANSTDAAPAAASNSTAAAVDNSPAAASSVNATDSAAIVTVTAAATVSAAAATGTAAKGAKGAKGGAAKGAASSAAAPAASSAAAPAASSTTAPAASSAAASTAGNLQTFTGTRGTAPPAVTPGGRGFVVAGSAAGDDFLNVGAALQRSCDVQHNACANAANSGAGGVSVNQCDEQDTQCAAAAKA